MTCRMTMTTRANLWNLTVKVPPEVRAAVRTEAKARGTIIRLVYAEALTDFLGRQQEGSRPQYRAAPKSGKQVTIWLEKDLVDAVKELSERDNVSITDLVLTALYWFCEAHGLAIDASS